MRCRGIVAYDVSARCVSFSVAMSLHPQHELRTEKATSVPEVIQDLRGDGCIRRRFHGHGKLVPACQGPPSLHGRLEDTPRP